MPSFETRRFRLIIAVGVVLTLVVCLINQIGLLTPLEKWFYDNRALVCQLFSKKPDDRIMHVDIDNAALDTGGVGDWPWPRSTVARIVSEIARAKPIAVGLDIRLDDKSPDSDEKHAPATEPADPDRPELTLAKAISHIDKGFLPVTFALPSAQHIAPEQATAMKILTEDLELSPNSFFHSINAHGVGFSSRSDLNDLYAHTLKLAVKSRVDEALKAQAFTDDELTARLLPHLDLSVNAVNSPLLILLRQQSADFRARQAFRRFGLDTTVIPKATVPCEFDQMPLPIYAKSVTNCAFVNADFLPGSTTRSMPLVVESEGKLYPQFGFAFGCAVLGADLRHATVEADRIVIPRPGGESIQIPTYTIHSEVLGRDCSSFIDIPWFGTSDYLTMYDWPAHRNKANHISANTVWDICRTIDKIKENNRNMDDAIVYLMRGDEDFSGLDRSFGKDYAASLPDAEDTDAREKASKAAFDQLAEQGWIEALQGIPAAERSAKERNSLTELVSARDALKTATKLNGLLKVQLDEFRANLASRLQNKGVLFGFTANGSVDNRNTSLHAECPGVVIHGVIAEAVLTNHWLRRVPSFMGVALILIFGLSTSAAVAQLQPFRALIATFLLAVVYLLVNGYVAFDFAGWIVPVAGPVTAISVVWSGCTLQRVIFEGIERNRVATEVALISREMELAHKVQAALIPKKPPTVRGIEAFGWTQPASTTGGDCYDLWELRDGRLAILLADASGHGLAPAMIVSQVRTLVRALSELDLHPCDLFHRVNARVAEDLEPGRFLTAFLGFLSPDGLLDYAAAGHGPQFWYTSDGTDFQTLDSTGVPLGFDNEWICQSPGDPIQIPENGTLVVFSDGLFEAMSPDQSLFGIERLEELLKANRGQPGKVITDQVTAAILQWQKNSPPNDDQTLVVARRVQPAAT